MAYQKVAIGTVVAIAITGMFLTLTTVGLLSVNQSITSQGNVSTVNVGVYSDSGCTQTLTSINWGNVSPGASTTKTAYVKNTGNVPITLTMTKTGWNPASANGPLTITWDRENLVLNANQVTTATLTLSVSSSVSGITSFSVNVTITGTG
jgi:hypothetical protein